MKSSIKVTGLCKKYSGFSLNDVSFSVPKGYVMGLIGENGAGKTTIIKSILDMINYEQGKIELFGKNLADNLELKEDIGVAMDLPFFVSDWTGKDIVRAVSSFYTKWDNEKFEKLCGYFSAPTDKKIKELSHGT